MNSESENPAEKNIPAFPDGQQGKWKRREPEKEDGCNVRHCTGDGDQQPGLHVG